MKKAIIVLYNTEVSEIIRYHQMICNYEIVQVVSPSGWGLSQKDAGSVDGGKPTEYIIRDDIDYSIEFDVVLLLILRILKTGISLEAMPPWVSENGFSSFQAVC